MRHTTVLSARPHLDRALASGVHGVGVLARELGREPSPGLLSAGKLRQSEHACVQPTATPHRSGALTAQGIGTAHTGGGTAYQRQRWRSCPVGSPAHPAVRCASSQRKAGPCSVSVPHGNAETNLRAEGEHAGAGRGGRHGGEAQSGLRGGCGDSGNERGLHVSVKNWVQVGFVLCVRAEFVVLGFRSIEIVLKSRKSEIEAGNPSPPWVFCKRVVAGSGGDTQGAERQASGTRRASRHSGSAGSCPRGGSSLVGVHAHPVRRPV